MRLSKLLLCFCLALLSVVLSACGGEKSGDTVKVGLLHSLTGPMAISETTLRDAELLAINEINAAGGVMGHKIVPIEENGASEPRRFAEKAKKLITTDKVTTIFGCWTSSSRKAVKSVIEQAGALLWYPLQYEGMEKSNNIMYTGATLNQQVIPAIEWLVGNGRKRMFLIGSDYIFPHTANSVIKALLRAKGGECVGEEYMPNGYYDFSNTIRRIKETNPDVIVNTINGEANVELFLQLRDAGITPEAIPVISFSIAEMEISAIGAENIGGNFVVWNYFETTDTPENEKFVVAYKKAYGGYRVTSCPIESAYSSVYIWKAAVEKAGTFERGPVRAAAKNIVYTAPSGTVKIDGSSGNIYCRARIGKIDKTGTIEEIYSTGLIKPDPFLQEYEWAKGIK